MDSCLDDFASSSDSSEDDSFSTCTTLKKAKKKLGRRAQWEERYVNDLIDVVSEDAYFRNKLIFTKSKPQKNKEVYAKVLKELSKRYEGEFPFSLEQIRVKFKSCVSQCKKISLLQKTASGVKNFVEEKGLGPWFSQLYSLVSSRDSCQPEQAVEPGSESRELAIDIDNNDADEVDSNSISLKRKNEDGSGKKFVPLKRKREKKSINDELKEAVVNFNKSIEKGETDLMNYLKEQNERARQHDRELFQMQCNMQLQMMEILRGNQHHQATFMPAFTPPASSSTMARPQNYAASSANMAGPQNYALSNNNSYLKYLQSDDV